jgi:PKD repeat protein
MRIGWARSLITLCLCLGMLAALAPAASAWLVREPNGHLISVAVHQGVSPASIPGSLASKAAAQGAAGFSAADNLTYHSGPVLRSVAPYVIYWTGGETALTATSESLMTRYFTDTAHDSGMPDDIYAVDRQFTDTTGFADYQQAFAAGTQAVVDTHPYPTTGNCATTGVTFPTCLTDTQLRAEIRRLIAANGWPEDGSSSTTLPDNAPLYFVVLPPDVNECFSTQCATNTFCAYHDSFTDGTSGNSVLYATIPTWPAANIPKSCQADGNAQVQTPNGDQVGDVSIKYTSHEFSEAITDPVPGTGWFHGTTGREDGDQCNFAGAYNPGGGSSPNAFAPTLGGTAGSQNLFNQLVNGNQYYIQSEWSNGDGNCEFRPSSGTITVGLTAPPTGTPLGTPVGLTPTGSSSNGYSSLTVDFGDGTSSFDNSGSVPGPLSHTYSHAGLYTAKIMAVDPMGNLAQGSTNQFAVGSPPAALFSVSATHAPNGVQLSFNASASSDPDAGVSLSSFAFNFGDGATAAGATATHAYSTPGNHTVTLTVTNSLGLTATASQTVTIIRATISKLRLARRTATGATIIVGVNAPGTLSGVGKRHPVAGPGHAKLKFTLSKSQLHQLAAAGGLVVHLKIKFAPLAGQSVTKKIRITFGKTIGHFLRMTAFQF